MALALTVRGATGQGLAGDRRRPGRCRDRPGGSRAAAAASRRRAEPARGRGRRPRPRRSTAPPPARSGTASTPASAATCHRWQARSAACSRTCPRRPGQPLTVRQTAVPGLHRPDAHPRPPAAPGVPVERAAAAGAGHRRHGIGHLPARRVLARRRRPSWLTRILTWPWRPPNGPSASHPRRAAAAQQQASSSRACRSTRHGRRSRSGWPSSPPTPRPASSRAACGTQAIYTVARQHLRSLTWAYPGFVWRLPCATRGCPANHRRRIPAGQGHDESARAEGCPCPGGRLGQMAELAHHRRAARRRARHADAPRPRSAPGLASPPAAPPGAQTRCAPRERASAAAPAATGARRRRRPPGSGRCPCSPGMSSATMPWTTLIAGCLAGTVVLAVVAHFAGTAHWQLEPGRRSLCLPARHRGAGLRSPRPVPAADPGHPRPAWVGPAGHILLAGPLLAATCWVQLRHHGSHHPAQRCWLRRPPSIR